MSVIFKTLEKLGRTSGEGKTDPSKDRKRRNIFSFKRAVFSVRGIIGTGLILSALILVAFLGISNLAPIFTKQKDSAVVSIKEPEPSDRLHVTGGKESPVKKEAKASDGPASEQDTLSEVIPKAPEYSPVKKPETGKLYLPTSPESTPKPEQPGYAPYMPPGSKPGPSESSFSGEERSPDVPAKTKELSAAGGARMEMETLPSAKAVRRGTVPEIEGAFRENRMTGKEGSPTRTAADDVPVIMRPIRPEVQSVRSEPMVRIPATEAAGVHEGVHKAEPEKIADAEIEKSARICRLVDKTQKAILAGDDSQVEKNLDELTLLKGEQSDYIIKLKAYWHMKQGDYDSARPLLDSLLQKNENDLDAGINMAVIEIKTHRMDEARKRLERLRDIYQDNTLIPSLLHKIGK